MNRIGTTLRWLLLAAGVLHCGSNEALPSTPELPRSAGAPEPGPAQGPAEPRPVEATPLDPEAPEPTGGQSGTDASDGSPAECPVPVPLDADATQDGVRLAWLVSRALAGFVAEGEFLGERMRMDLSLVADGTALRQYGPMRVNGRLTGLLCDRLDVPVRVTLTGTPAAADGERLSVVDSPATLQFYPGRGELRFAFEYENYSNPARLRAERLPPQAPEGEDRLYGWVTVLMSYATEPFALHQPRLTQISIDWLSPNGSALFGPLSAPAAAAPAECSQAEPTAAVTFAGRSEALAALAGDWALCGAGAAAGVQISQDGSWRSIALESEPRILMGLGHEGVVVVRDSDGNEPASDATEFSFSLQQPGLAWGVGSDVLHLMPLSVSASGNTLALQELVRLNRAVAPAEAPAFAEGERAGLAGCASSEAGLGALGSDAEAVHAALAGRWVGCAGFAGEIEFDAQGRVTVLPSESYAGSAAQEVVITDLGAASGLSVPSNGWRVVRSTRPLKLWLRAGNLLDYDAQPIVLSAAP